MVVGRTEREPGKVKGGGEGGGGEAGTLGSCPGGVGGGGLRVGRQGTEVSR